MELKIPKHPTHDYKCIGCKHWLKSERKHYLLTQMGPQPLTIPTFEVPVNQVWANMAPCTRMPDWTMKSKDHWCAEYVGTVKIN